MKKLFLILALIFLGFNSCGTLEDEWTCTMEGCTNDEDADLRTRVGPPGPQGPPGQDGIDGKDGKNGVDGLDGQDGLDGKDGIDGQDGQDAIQEIIDPCGDNPGYYDEVLFRLNVGEDEECIAAYFRDGSKEFLVCLPPGNYVTTDRQACQFTVSEDMELSW